MVRGGSHATTPKIATIDTEAVVDGRSIASKKQADFPFVPFTAGTQGLLWIRSTSVTSKARLVRRQNSSAVSFHSVFEQLLNCSWLV